MYISLVLSIFTDSIIPQTARRSMIKVTLFLAPPPHVQATYLPEWSHNDLSGRDALNAHPSAAISTTSERRFTSDNELALLAKNIRDSFYLSSALDAGIRNPKRGEILSFDGTRWINSQVALNGGGGQGVSELSKLLDVSLGAAHTDDILVWDSVVNKWTNNNDRVIYAKGKASQTIEGNLLVTGNITAFAANGQVVTIWDSMPYATIDKVGGVRVSNVFTKGIRINNGVLEIDPDYAGGVPDLTPYATKAWVTQTVIGSAPENLNALNELATALGNDPNFATTITNLIGTKSPINNPIFTGVPKVGVNDIWHAGNLNKSDIDFTARDITVNRIITTPIIKLSSPNYPQIFFHNSTTNIDSILFASKDTDNLIFSPDTVRYYHMYSQNNANKLNVDWSANDLKSRTVKISDANGVTQWTAQLGVNNSLEFYNASNVLEFRLSQSGRMDVRDNVAGFSTFN